MDIIELNITGMSCNHCVAHTKKALEAVPGVMEVEVRLEPGNASIKGENLDAESLVEAVKNAGYEASVG